MRQTARRLSAATPRHSRERALPGGRPSQNPAGKGFTLTELLIAIAILAVLAGLLLTALDASRQHARKAACLSNLHQIGLALNQYAPENNYRMPCCTMAPGAEPPVVGEENLPSIRETLRRELPEADVWRCPDDPDGAFFQQHGLSYEWQSSAINGRKLDERTFEILGFQRFILMDFDPFHGDAGDPGARNFLYLNARAAGRLDPIP